MLCQQLKKWIQMGWPKRLKTEHDTPETRALFAKRYQITYQDHCLWWGSRVILPNKLRLSYLQLMHKEHVGIKNVAIVKDLVWWPRIVQDIASYIENRRPCLQVPYKYSISVL